MMKKSQAYRPFAGGYVSEFDQFMESYLASHPKVERERQDSWYIWWDHRIDLDELDKERADSVPEKPYHYE